jgi:hypothetical protein
MKLVPMADLVAVILYPQRVSDVDHEIGVNGSPRCRIYVSSVRE